MPRVATWLLITIAVIAGNRFMNHYIGSSNDVKASTLTKVSEMHYTPQKALKVPLEYFELSINLAKDEINLSGATPDQVGVTVIKDTVEVPVIKRIKDTKIEWVEVNPRPRTRMLRESNLKELIKLPEIEEFAN